MKTLVLKLGIRGLQFGDVKHKKKLPNVFGGHLSFPNIQRPSFSQFFLG
jgi:hypothetical protein